LRCLASKMTCAPSCRELWLRDTVIDRIRMIGRGLMACAPVV